MQCTGVESAPGCPNGGATTKLPRSSRCANLQDGESRGGARAATGGRHSQSIESRLAEEIGWSASATFHGLFSSVRTARTTL
jgi:hypothetical protein